jgi:hypothetical protein
MLLRVLPSTLGGEFAVWIGRGTGRRLHSGLVAAWRLRPESASSKPILNVQAADTFELAGIGGHDRGAAKGHGWA